MRQFNELQQKLYRAIHANADQPPVKTALEWHEHTLPLLQLEQEYQESLRYKIIAADQALAATLDELYWPAGSAVEFKWRPPYAGQSAELIAWHNVSWTAFELTLNDILKIIRL